MFGNNRSFTKHARRVQKPFSPRLCFVLLICPVQAGHSFDPSILGLCLVLPSLCHEVVGPDKPGDHIDFNPISFPLPEVLGGLLGLHVRAKSKWCWVQAPLFHPGRWQNFRVRRMPTFASCCREGSDMQSMQLRQLRYAIVQGM